MGHKQIHDVDAAVAVLPEVEVPAELARANEEFAELVRVEPTPCWARCSTPRAAP